MFKKLSVSDFEVLRGPLESGRQSPNSLGGILILSIFLQALFFSIEYFIAADSTIYPNKDQILSIHFWITIIIMFFSVIYAIPAVYRRSQKLQYLISIVVSQNLLTGSLFISALFLIGDEAVMDNMNVDSLMTFTFIIILFGALIFNCDISKILYFVTKRALP